jgi:prepilin-type N-terminal cleavage/methylation domain-containing protein
VRPLVKPEADSRDVGATAFTLLEVLIAMTIFCIAVFAILDLTSRCLRSARALQTSFLNANSLAAELSLTNRLYEGPLPPELIGRFEEQHPGYTCDGEITLVGTNGLFQVDLAVVKTAGKAQVESQISVLLYRPDSPFMNKGPLGVFH